MPLSALHVIDVSVGLSTSIFSIDPDPKVLHYEIKGNSFIN
jgi:hypothetical protein